MRRSPRPRRTPVYLSASLHQRLNSYALAASAAGVGILALAQASEAKIVYTHTHHVIGPHHRYTLDLNRDGIGDFTIRNSYGCNQDWCFDQLYAVPGGGNGVQGARGFLGIPYAYALAGGASIGPKQPFSGQLMASDNMGYLGQWLNVANRYLGLKFQIKGKTHYGWARLSVSDRSPHITATLTGYAYETIPNQPILAGKTHGNDVIAVAPSSLGHLAQGASGLSAWRNESAEPTHSRRIP